MSFPRLVLVAALTATIAACGGSDDPVDGGAGGWGGIGTGGSGGGSGGSGGSAAPATCGAGVRVLELDGNASPAVIEDVLDPADNWYGSCSPEFSVGNDVIVRYRAAETGYHRFTTEGSPVDTLLLALRDCTDGFSEIACNDDAPDSRQSRIVLHLEEGQEVFLVVDTVDVKQAAPFRLAAERVELTRPTIGDANAYAIADPKLNGVRATGANPDGRITGFEMALYRTSGGAIIEPTVFEIRNVNWATVTETGGEYFFEAAFALGGGTGPTVGKIEFRVIDENGLASDPVTLTVQEPPTLDRGTACDPTGLFGRCAAGDACVPGPGGTGFVCAKATAPVLTQATGFRNLVDWTWGVVVEGTDDEDDIIGVRLYPKDSEGVGLPIDTTGRAVRTFHWSTNEGGITRGIVAMDAVFRGVCTNPTTAQQCWKDTLQAVATVEVELIDATGKLSEKFEIVLGDSPDAALGEACDPWGATGRCPDGAVCWNADPAAPEICQADPPICPEGYAMDVLVPNGQKWTYDGDNRDAEAHGRTSCGAGGPSDVIVFTAPATGTYRFETSNLQPGVDTVLAVRSYCQLPGYELACNDNAAGTPESRVFLAMEMDETVFIVVDSVDGASLGTYLLTVSRED